MCLFRVCVRFRFVLLVVYMKMCAKGREIEKTEYNSKQQIWLIFCRALGFWKMETIVFEAISISSSCPFLLNTKTVHFDSWQSSERRAWSPVIYEHRILMINVHHLFLHISLLLLLLLFDIAVVVVITAATAAHFPFEFIDLYLMIWLNCLFEIGMSSTSATIHGGMVIWHYAMFVTVYTTYLCPAGVRI